MLSVIFSATDEIENEIFWKSIEQINQLEDQIELIIVIDQKRYSDTATKVKSIFPQCKIIHSETNLRSERINLGIKAASNAYLLLQHPRSVLARPAYEYLINHGNRIPWGGFTHTFNEPHRLLKFTSWYSNYVRLKFSSIVYLDHCIFINRNYFRKIDLTISLVDIFEDTELSKILKKFYPATLIPHQSLTSAIRFNKNGIYKQATLNQLLKLGYHFGLSPKRMNKIYEKGLSLNSNYLDKKKKG